MLADSPFTLPLHGVFFIEATNLFPHFHDTPFGLFLFESIRRNGKRKKVSTCSRLFGYKRGLTRKFNTNLEVFGRRAFLVCAGGACLLWMGMPPATGGKLDSRPQMQEQLGRTVTFAERATYQYAIE